MKAHRSLIAAMAIAIAFLTGCTSDAHVASQNISTEADSFKVYRRVVFFNGITDTYLLSIEGFCSIQDEGKQLEVTCQTGIEEYKKHFLGLSDNVSYFVEQLDPSLVSPHHYKVVFKPEAILPDVEVRISSQKEDSTTVESSEQPQSETLSTRYPEDRFRNRL